MIYHKEGPGASNGTYQLLAYADGTYLLGDHVDIVKKDVETSTAGSKKIGQEMNYEKTECMLLTHPSPECR
jgi:hypothetical protein